MQRVVSRLGEQGREELLQLLQHRVVALVGRVVWEDIAERGMAVVRSEWAMEDMEAMDRSSEQEILQWLEAIQKRLEHSDAAPQAGCSCDVCKFYREVIQHIRESREQLERVNAKLEELLKVLA